MTINEAYLVALRATVTLTYIPVMAPGLYDTFPWPPETFPGHIRWFPGPFLIEILVFYTDLFILFWVSRVLLCIIDIMVIMW